MADALDEFAVPTLYGTRGNDDAARAEIHEPGKLGSDSISRMIALTMHPEGPFAASAGTVDAIGRILRKVDEGDGDVGWKCVEAGGTRGKVVETVELPLMGKIVERGHAA